MGIGMIKRVDGLGRVTIPKEYREFYHMNENDMISLIDTPQGLLLSNPRYKIVEIDDKADE